MKKSFISILLFLSMGIITDAFAQWIPTNGPYGGGVYLSTNKGINWTAVDSGLTYPYVSLLAVSGTNLFAVAYGSGVFLSTNFGTSWTQVNSGLNNKYVYSIAVNQTNLFAGLFYGGVWRKPLSEMITDVKGVQNNWPTSFSLQQNYPNPFNPSTMIDYSIPKTSLVTIKLYDILGKEILTVVNEEKSAGNYSVQFNGGNLSSGIYFYRMQSGNFVETKKLLLLK